MNKNFTYGVLIFLSFLTIFLVVIEEYNDSSQAEDGLKIIEATETLGPIYSVNNTTIQAYTYDFVLYNDENEEIYLDSIELLFTKYFLARVLTENHKIIGNKTMKPHSTVHVKGQVEFNASGLSKEQLLNLDHIYSVNVTSTKTLLFFPKGGS